MYSSTTVYILVNKLCATCILCTSLILTDVLVNKLCATCTSLILTDVLVNKLCATLYTCYTCTTILVVLQYIHLHYVITMPHTCYTCIT